MPKICRCCNQNSIYIFLPEKLKISEFQWYTNSKWSVLLSGNIGKFLLLTFNRDTSDLWKSGNNVFLNKNAWWLDCNNGYLFKNYSKDSADILVCSGPWSGYMIFNFLPLHLACICSSILYAGYGSIFEIDLVYRRISMYQYLIVFRFNGFWLPCVFIDR